MRHSCAVSQRLTTTRSPADTVFDQLKQGYNAGAWTGNGIASAAAAGDATARTGIGFAEAMDVLGPAGGVQHTHAADQRRARVAERERQVRVEVEREVDPSSPSFESFPTGFSIE